MTPQRYQRRHTRDVRLRNADRWQRRRLRLRNAPEAILASIPSLPRPALERLAQRIIDRLDDMDGDPDHEPDGEETDGTNADDEAISPAVLRMLDFGPGCSVADPGEDVDNAG